MKTRFPKPWRLEWVGDAFRVFDANDRHLFVIVSDEILNEEEKPGDATVLGFGSNDEINDLFSQIEQVFHKGNIL